MGRAGRSGGGGRSSGGSRSSGGRGSSRSSSSGRSGRSSYSGSSSSHKSTSSWGHSSGHLSSGHHHSSCRYHGGHYRGRPASGCLSVFVAVIIIVYIVAVLFGSMDSSVPTSTWVREPLPKNSAALTFWYKDDLSWIGSGSTLERGLKSFHDETGVQPVLYITDTIYDQHYEVDSSFNDRIQEYAEDLYNQWFKDQAHMLVIFYEYDNKHGIGLWIGDQASSIIDEEAIDILWANIEKYYYGDLNEDAMFSKAFSDTAKRIMSVTKPWWHGPAIGLCVIIVLVILVIWWSKHKRQKNLEAEQAERILSTPIDQIGNQSTGLEDKYK